MDYIDGEPLEEDVPQAKKKKTGAFVPSKWETVDPEQIEAQAMTTSKWDLLEPPQQVSYLYVKFSPRSPNTNAIVFFRKKKVNARVKKIVTMITKTILKANSREIV